MAIRQPGLKGGKIEEQTPKRTMTPIPIASRTRVIVISAKSRLLAQPCYECVLSTRPVNRRRAYTPRASGCCASVRSYGQPRVGSNAQTEGATRGKREPSQALGYPTDSGHMLRGGGRRDHRRGRDRRARLGRYRAALGARRRGTLDQARCRLDRAGLRGRRLDSQGELGLAGRRGGRRRLPPRLPPLDDVSS